MAHSELIELLDYLQNEESDDGTSFETKICQRCFDQRVIEAMLELIVDKYEDTKILTPVCGLLLRCYQPSREPSIRTVALQAVPAVMWAYLDALSNGKRSVCAPIEPLLLLIYNLDVVDNNAQRVRRYRIPNLANPSLYHDPANLMTSLNLTENALGMRPGDEPISVQVGPFPAISRINAENRALVLTQVLRIYNDNAAKMYPCSIQTVCRLCSRICRGGFHFKGAELVDKVLGPLKQRKHSQSKTHEETFREMDDFSGLSRVVVHSPFLLELVNSVYFAIFNQHAVEGLRALDDMHQRCVYELFPDIFLVTNAIINSLLENPSGHPGDGPLGLKVTEVTSPATSKHGLVTNASVRYKRLPEDIPTSAGIVPLVEVSSRETTPVHTSTTTTTSASNGVRVSSPVKSVLPKQLASNKESTNVSLNLSAGNSTLKPAAVSIKSSTSEVNMKKLFEQQRCTELRQEIELRRSESPPRERITKGANGPIVENGNERRLPSVFVPNDYEGTDVDRISVLIESMPLIDSEEADGPNSIELKENVNKSLRRS